MVKFKQAIHPGDVGRDVKAVKHALKRWGHKSVNTRTAKASVAYVQALKEFQKNHGLKPDGVYGRKTHKKAAPGFTKYEKWLYKTAKLRDPNRARRQRIVKWAAWGAAHEPAIHYSMSSIRSSFLYHTPGTLPMTTDCSGFFTFCYWAAGLIRLLGLGSSTVGATGTILMHAKSITTNLRYARVGDAIVIGPGSGDHVVVVVKVGVKGLLLGNPLCVSHGQEAGPRYEHVLQDPRTPKRVCKYL